MPPTMPPARISRRTPRSQGTGPTVAAGAVLALLLAGAAHAQVTGRDRPVFANRTACLEKAEALPDHAFADAKLWERQSGGADARLCQAVALLFQGEWVQAADRLEAAIREPNPLPLPTVAQLWGRIGWAWLSADELVKAEEAYGKALALRPDDLRLRLERALVRGAAERFWDAVADLDAVIAAQPDDQEARLLRAEAQRRLGRNTEALNDLTHVLILAPQTAEAWLQRGNLRMELGDEAGARGDWIRARQSGGDAPAGRRAAENIDRLDGVQRQPEQP